ncbi:poly(A) RNA polymerase gld-2 homolog A-like [Cataglyphis hispanica]|uniref:poly(A) RNA polymerase gld-2 homolog A-like n=1 Tax=Cataglyphis hispanica TaxID=1086592 RepID=UPI00218081C0|nr:poly(A) RNA polymerase gld-2 homolog A-like [Cataglyphis hispanica]XP_050448464.1 poly(A) RNA polymerase gld-2 homolog A-like [Cataglyphis hispanica]XP_050448465.1 poly(A) RNA polymerase gld-2 homolog A-like [Cataglyphis hispanica]
MYHTVFPSQMMVQIMGGQQTGGQCPPAQTHTLHINGINGLHQTDFTSYGPDISRHNRPHTMQTGSHPLEFLQLMGLDVPSLRHIEYMQSNNSSPGNWERRMGTSNNTSIIPPSNYNLKPTNTHSIKKPSWNNRNGRRSTYRNSYSKYETYNSDSGFSSRSPTPNKYHIDNSLTESSDERDSTSSLRGQEIKKYHRIHSDNRAINKPISSGLISSASAHQFYQNQRPVNYYNTVSTPRSHAQNYQNRRKYLSGRSESAPCQRFLRNRKFSEVLLPNYNLVSTYIIAPDRFLAKSHMMEVTSAPRNIMTGSKWDNLSQQIWLKFMSNQQTEATYRNKMMLWKHLYIYIKRQYPKYGLFVVGSTMNGFGSDNSDVDMCLLVRHTEMDQKYEAVEHLGQILKYLKKCDFIEQLELIHAKVPIIKFCDTIQDLKVDLNCNNAVGIRNTQLLYCYSKLDWRVKPLVLVIKLWAQYHDINNAKNMTISSYSLVLMVIHFLQCGINPPVLPCLHSIFGSKFSPHTDIHNIDIHEDLNIPSSNRLPENHQSLGELFVEFFRYYVKFDFSHYAISVRLAKKILIEECRMVQSLKNDYHQWKYLCIEEPFDLTNTARSVYDPDVFARIKQLIDETYQRLQKKHDLNSIFLNIITDVPITRYL